MPPRRDLLRFRTKLAEQSERFDDMVKLITLLAQDAETLNGEERNLLSSAYKNSISARRSSLRAIASLKKKNKSADDVHVDDKMRLMYREYKTKIEQEIQRLCNDVLEILESSLIRKSTTPESKVYYGKLRADYYRYKSEAAEGTIKEEAERMAGKVYEEALQLAREKLSVSNSILLGVALNYSVYLNEIKGEQQAALSLCKETLDNALMNIEKGAPEVNSDTKRILQLIRDNITLWNVNVEH